MVKKYSSFISNKNFDLTNVIEYSILKDNYNTDKIFSLLDQATNRNIKMFCILDKYIYDVKTYLDKNIKIISTIDFPEGNMKQKERIKSVTNSIISDADEIDLCIKNNLFKNNKKREKLIDELQEISDICHRNGKIFKIIINLNDFLYDEIKTLASSSVEIGVDYIQTSTAQETDFKKATFLKKILPDHINLKITGQIRDVSQVKQYLTLGRNTRIGTSSLII
jgi:deoxyribose-phosphate aldolase